MKFSKKLLTLALAGILTIGSAGSTLALWQNYGAYGGFEGRWKRFYGRDRIKTAEYTANSLNPHKNATDVYQLSEGQGVPTVLVNHESFQDGLSAYNLCKAFNARLLLIKPDYANIGLMRDYYKSKTVYILGSEKEIYKSTENYIKKYMPKAKVIRIGNSNPYERNLASIKMAGFNNVVVADGRKFPDALSASGLCNLENLGLRLVDGSKSYSQNGLTTVYTVGGADSVSQEGGKRLFGNDRYDTGKEVARQAKGYLNIVFVDGRKFPDSVSGINLVKPRTAIVLPISDDRNNSDMKEFLAALPKFENTDSWDVEKCGAALVVGGHNSVSDQTVQKMLYPSK